jgi:asparagine synthase (glutamine-hydrolysing)
MVAEQVHAFAIGIGLDDDAAERLRVGVIDVAQEFQLDLKTLWQETSPTGVLTAAGSHSSKGAIGDRRYVARSATEIALYDGLPIDGSGDVTAHDAEQLLEHWTALPESLEGQFCVGRIDLAADALEILMDPLGMLPVFYARVGRAAALSTSAGIVASVLGLRSPDHLAIASFVALGWAMGRHTFLADTQSLPGGCVHRIDAGSLRSSQHFGAAALADSKRTTGEALSAEAVAEQLQQLTSAAIGAGGPVRCALTAGRDTRVLAAILRSIGAKATYYTEDGPDWMDAVIGSELAARFELPHLVHRASESQRNWTHAADRFVRQNDGLSSLVQLVDYQPLDGPIEQLGITLWGVGGEIGRAGAGAVSNISPNLPILSRLVFIQRKLLGTKIDDQALLTEDGRELVARGLQSFLDDRLREGWPVRELSESFYTFERVACWGATGVRRVSGTSDLFSPYCTRPFIRYCFSLSPSERYLEAPHYRLLGQLDPALREHRFESPLPPQQRWLAPVLATRQLWRTLRSSQRHGGAREVSADKKPPFSTRWLEAHTHILCELVDSADPEIWQLVDRSRVMRLLQPDCADRPAYTETLLRIFTPLWSLYARECSAGAEGTGDLQPAKTASHASASL